MKFFKSLFASADSFKLNSASAQSFIENWTQIKTYYEVLSRTFQAAEKGNLEFIKSDSEILLEKAEALTIEGMPAAYRNPKAIETLLSLRKQSATVNHLVKKQVDDAEIKLALTKLYEVFYSIVELSLSEK